MAKTLTERIPIVLVFKLSLSLVIGLLLGVTGALSFLRTSWISYHVDFFFWWSIVSTFIGFILICFSLWQYLEAESQKTRTKAQIKIWMQDAKGIVSALSRIRKANHTAISDVCNSIEILDASASSLYQSLYEERVVKEEDYQQAERRATEILEEQRLQGLQNQASSGGRNTFVPIKSTGSSKKADSAKSHTGKEAESPEILEVK